MPNPGTVSQGDIDKLEQGMKDLTSLSQQLSKTFRDINKETDVLSNNFKNIVRQAGLNNNNAERYLISQKLQEATQNRINEIKAKSSYLDSVSLAFKREEGILQARIVNAQITALQSTRARAGIDNAERLRAIESLKIQNTMNLAALRYQHQNASAQSKVLKDLKAQLNTIEGFTPNLQTNNVFVRELKNIFGERIYS